MKPSRKHPKHPNQDDRQGVSEGATPQRLRADIHKPHAQESLGSGMPILPPLGFTLLELMMTIAVLGIIMGIAVPSFMSSMINARLTTTANDFLASLQLARSESLRTQGRITMCKANATATQCDASNTTDWTIGWMVFTDPTPQNPPALEGTSRILSRGGQGLASGITIRSSDPNLRLYASFVGDGSSRQMDGNLLAGIVRVCSNSSSIGNNDRARDIVISSNGRAVIQRPTGVAASCPAP